MTGTSTLTAQQAARILGVSAWKVKDLAREGKLSATRTAGAHRRYDRDEVRELATFMHGSSEPECHAACGFGFAAPEHLARCLRPAARSVRPVRCGQCGYRFDAPGHLSQCSGSDR